MVMRCLVGMAGLGVVWSDELWQFRRGADRRGEEWHGLVRWVAVRQFRRDEVRQGWEWHGQVRQAGHGLVGSGGEWSGTVRQANC